MKIIIYFALDAKLEKKKKYFKPISKNKEKRSIICDLCNKENINKCTKCGKIFPESKLSKINNDMLACISCVI